MVNKNSLFLIVNFVVVQIERKQEINEEVSYAVHVTHHAFQRHDLLAQIGFKVRMLYLLAFDMVNYPNTREEFEAGIRQEVLRSYHSSLI